MVRLMEELRSTEILDKEIRTDSGKKAELIRLRLWKMPGQLKKALTYVLQKQRKKQKKHRLSVLNCLKKTHEALFLWKSSVIWFHIYILQLWRP